MNKYCKGCLHHNKGKQNTKYADWCCRHSTTAKNARSICIIQGSKEVKGD